MLHQTAGLKHKILKLFWFTVPIQRATHLTAISTATKEDILHFVPCNPDKISIVYVSIQDRFQPFPKSFNQHQPRILHVGTAPNKNLERLIPALKDIPCTLVIVGKVNDSIKALIQENNIQAECIERRLSDEEILDQYRQSDILSLVSTLEGFGMPIVEANAVGRSVITSNTTSMPEIAGDAAVLVDPFDISSIREGFLKIIENSQLREELVQNGLQNHLRFQPKQLAAQYAELYSQLLRG
jgi:glycosyltransferase involved in cell wall biosynthesis